MSEETPYSLFEVSGLELEYMLVSRKDLSVLPAVDRLILSLAGEITTDFVEENTGYANELALHVIEVRTDEPVRKYTGLAGQLQQAVGRLNTLAASFDARLMPGAAHPWMNPAEETRLWPHEYREVYERFDAIFNCRRHGWANLQSCQLNLPFADDAEFEKLHAAIRVLLPLMPALASSSPVLDGKVTGLINSRLEVYKDNASRVPLVAGHCIPERVFSKRDYENILLESIYEQIRPLDPGGNLQNEWLNARGAIARFDRQAIEIRVLDMQECPAADVAICGLLTGVLKKLCDGAFAGLEQLKSQEIAPLKAILDDHIRNGEKTVITDRDFLALWGIREKKILSCELWDYFFRDKNCCEGILSKEDAAPIKTILREGVLSRRILKALGPSFNRKKLAEVYAMLCQCLEKGVQFHA